VVVVGGVRLRPRHARHLRADAASVCGLVDPLPVERASFHGVDQCTELDVHVDRAKHEVDAGADQVGCPNAMAPARRQRRRIRNGEAVEPELSAKQAPEATKPKAKPAAKPKASTAKPKTTAAKPKSTAKAKTTAAKPKAKSATKATAAKPKAKSATKATGKKPAAKKKTDEE